MQAAERIEQLKRQHPDERIDWIIDAPLYEFEYPSLAWPTKAKTYNLDKNPIIEDVLMAVKGQYLIFENACLNIRKYGSYQVSLAQI